MSETYRKRGRVVRWENGTLVRVTESGVAIEEGDVFTCHPERREGFPPSGEDGVIATVQQITSLIDELTIERLIVTHGIAEHECDGRTWREETKRVHVSLVKGRMRALIDSVDDVERIAAALARAEEGDRPAPARLRLAPNVTAALIPSLVALAPPNVRVSQSAGGVDGKGFPVAEGGEGWYRPSYRIRPVRMPLNVRLHCDVTAIERDRPLAVALLAPPDGLVLRVLVEDGARVYPATVRVARIDAVAAEGVWYPYGGGSFGAEMML
ncbi:MAG TPA: hypothetical protein VHL59_17645 [Thermoanaerobaculia bacterium]|nr:hypothetical protein [Thermoanaerobaculia bacterium]